MNARMLAPLMVALVVGCSSADDEATAGAEASAELPEQAIPAAAPMVEAPEGDGAVTAQVVPVEAVQPVVEKPAAPASGELPDGAVRVQPAQIMDRTGFGQPLVAVATMIPIGWQTEGGVQWVQNLSGCGKNNPHFAWAATAPDGIGRISVMPDETWSGSRSNSGAPIAPQGGPCPNILGATSEQLVRNYVERYRPGAQLIEYRDRPDIIDEVQQYLQAGPTTAYGTETRQWAISGEAIIGYAVDGREVREVVAVAAAINLMRMAGVSPGEVWEYFTTSILPAFGMRMAADQLDLRQAELFRKAGKPGPTWQAQMAQHRAKMAGIQAKGIADRARITAETNREISEMQMDSWRRQQGMKDRGQRETSETIRGVETYDDPTLGETVELDSDYENAWRLDDGTYVLTDDPSFNPYAVTGQGGERLEPTP